MTEPSKSKSHNKLQRGTCFNCNSLYEDIRIGKKHIYGVCPTCKILDEIGIVFRQ